MQRSLMSMCCAMADVFVAGILEHIEEAGVHSGDSACSMPPHSLSQNIIDELGRQAAGNGFGAECEGLDECAICRSGRTDFRY
jgi:carbamoyl-phosphate synthase large subunit